MRAEEGKTKFRKLQNFGPGHRSHDEKYIIYTMYVPLTSKMIVNTRYMMYTTRRHTTMDENKTQIWLSLPPPPQKKIKLNISSKS